MYVAHYDVFALINLVERFFCPSKTVLLFAFVSSLSLKMESKSNSSELEVDYDRSIEKISDTSSSVPLETLNFDLLTPSGLTVSEGKEEEWQADLESLVDVLFEFSDGSLSPMQVLLLFLFLKIFQYTFLFFFLFFFFNHVLR